MPADHLQPATPRPTPGRPGGSTTGGEAQLRGLMEDLSLACLVLDRSGRVTFCNRYLLSLAGWERDEVLGRPWFEMLMPAASGKERERFLEDLASGTAGPLETAFETRTGERKSVAWAVSFMRDPSGGHAAAVLIGNDITAHRQMDEQLREAEARYRTLVEQIPAVTYIEALDEANTDIFVSPQIEEMLGFTQKEWLEDAELWARQLHPEDRDRVLAEDELLDETGLPFSIEYRMLSRDGRTVWIREEASLMRDGEGNPLFWHGVMLDITGLKTAEAELRRALHVERKATKRLREVDEMKNAFLTAVSHELRTPLSAILGSAITLERDDSGEHKIAAEDRSGLVRGIAGNADRLTRLLADLLDLDRLTRGILTPNRRLTDLRVLALGLADSSAVGETHRLVVEAEPLTVAVDAPMVERMLENLLVNAAKYSPAGGTIWVRARPARGGALIEVEDQGPGVPDELKDSVFDAFRQGPNASRYAPGVGIGLSLVARFTTLHGGQAWVRDGVDGACFCVFLPDGPEEQGR